MKPFQYGKNYAVNCELQNINKHMSEYSMRDMHACVHVYDLWYICVYYADIVIYTTIAFVSESFCHHIFYSKMRAKLGLKPLQVDDGGNKENGIIQSHNV